MQFWFGITQLAVVMNKTFVITPSCCAWVWIVHRIWTSSKSTPLNIGYWSFIIWDHFAHSHHISSTYMQWPRNERAILNGVVTVIVGKLLGGRRAFLKALTVTEKEEGAGLCHHLFTYVQLNDSDGISLFFSEVWLWCIFRSLWYRVNRLDDLMFYADGLGLGQTSYTAIISFMKIFNMYIHRSCWQWAHSPVSRPRWRREEVQRRRWHAVRYCNTTQMCQLQSCLAHTLLEFPG